MTLITLHKVPPQPCYCSANTAVLLLAAYILPVMQEACYSVTAPIQALAGQTSSQKLNRRSITRPEANVDVLSQWPASRKGSIGEVASLMSQHHHWLLFSWNTIRKNIHLALHPVTPCLFRLCWMAMLTCAILLLHQQFEANHESLRIVCIPGGAHLLI